MRPASPVTCAVCGVMFLKENRMITKTLARGGVDCCSRKCSCDYVSTTAKQKSNPFKYYLINIRKRNTKLFKDTCIVTAEYLEQLWEKQRGLCAITGVAMVHSKQRQDKSLFQASVDRIDNAKGYVEGNVQFTTLGANYLRNTLSMQSVMEYLQEVKNA